jgi:hypothetical protein
LKVAISPGHDRVDDQPTTVKEASQTLDPVYQSTSRMPITDTSDEEIYKPKGSLWKTGLSSRPRRGDKIILNDFIPKDAEKRGRRQHRQTRTTENSLGDVR